MMVFLKGTFVAALVLMLTLFIAGCTTQTKVEYRDVMVPTPTLPDVPQELAEPVAMPLPQFVSPDDPQAVAAMTAEQTQVFQKWTLYMKAQIDGFRVLMGLEKPP